MRTHPVRWLYEELPKLVQGGVLDAAAAENLKQHYGPPPVSPWKTGAMTLIGTLGALLLGGGVILLFAHNWDVLSRSVRAALSIALLVFAQLLAGFAIWKRPRSAAWTEGAAVFLSGAVVAAIGLIAQTYQIAWGVETILLAWVLLTAPLVYAMRSQAAAVLVWIGSTAWLFQSPWGHEGIVWGPGYLGLVGLVVPFMVYLHKTFKDEGRTLFLNWVAAGSITLAAIRIGSEAGDPWRLLLAGLFGCFYLFGARKEKDAAGPWWRSPYRTLGGLGLAVMMFLFTFRGVWEAERGMSETGGVPAVGLIGLAMSVLALFYGFRFLNDGRAHRAVLLLTPALAVLGMAAVRFDHHTSIMAVSSNAAMLTAGLTLSIDGFRRRRLGAVNGGLLLLLAVFLARFLDFDLTFLVRGVAFILAGSGFLAVNGWLHYRSRKEVAS